MTKMLQVLKTSWKIIWRIFLFFITWGLILTPFVVPINASFSNWINSSFVITRLYGDTVTLFTILAATWLMTRYIDHRPFQTIGFAFNHLFRDMLIGIATGLLWLVASVGIAWLSGWASLATPVGFSWQVLIVSAVAMLFNVVAQELLLCGFIFQTIYSRANIVIAIIISAGLFAGYHAGAFKGDWLPAVNVFTAGLLFCLAYILTGNLWFPIAIHFTWDVLLGPVLGLTESGKSNLGGGWKMLTLNRPSLFTGGKFGLEGGLVVTLITVAILILICFLQRDKIKNLLLN